jgi:hypothetical protein
LSKSVAISAPTVTAKAENSKKKYYPNPRTAAKSVTVTIAITGMSVTAAMSAADNGSFSIVYLFLLKCVTSKTRSRIKG